MSPVSPFGPVGPKGDTGQAKPIETNYEAILFASYAQAHYSRIMVFQELISIPENNDIIVKLNDTHFSVIVGKYLVLIKVTVQSFIYQILMELLYKTYHSN